MIGANLVGLFNSATWSIRQTKEPLFVLGRYSPAEITPTAQEAVTIDLVGYRIVNAGPYQVAGATKLINLLTEEDFTVTVLDRQTGEAIFTAQGCRVQGWSSGTVQRGVSDIRLSVIGLIGWDESSNPNGDNESSNASSLTDGA